MQAFAAHRTMENGKTDYFNVEDIQIYNGRERTAAIYP
jgi:hypothetical protein